MEQFCCVVLAAGQGKRMNSQKPKVLHPVLEKPMIDWVTDAAKKAGAQELCVVCGHQKEQLLAHLGQSVHTVLQEQQLGTGHAVQMAESFLQAHRGEQVVILSGDVPLLSPEVLSGLFHAHLQSGAKATVLTGKLPDPTGYGRILKDESGAVCAIVEQKDATPEQLQIGEINAGIYCFSVDTLLAALGELCCENAQREYYLTDTISVIRRAGGRIGSFCCENTAQLLGVNDRIQLQEVQQTARLAILRRLMLGGVTVMDSATTFVGPDVTIGPDTVLHPGVELFGSTAVGSNCVIGQGSQLRDTAVGDNTTINCSVLLRCTVGSDTTVGPFAYLRPGTNVGDHARIGDFVEVKNSNIGRGTKVSHLTYIGDSDVGEDCNFGCGTVTVNYDGKAKYRTTIGNRAFIGCNVNLIAPVCVHDDSYIAAGSTITDDVEPFALAIARARQVTKPDWVKKQEGKKQ